MVFQYFLFSCAKFRLDRKGNYYEKAYEVIIMQKANSLRFSILIFGLIQCIFLFFARYSPADEVPYNYNHGLGPLDFRSSSPGQSIRLIMPILMPASVKPGLGINIVTSTSNVWLNENQYIIDYEIVDAHMELTYGFNNDLGLIVFFDQRHYWGGFMDGFIEKFHDMFGIEQDGRDQWPNNETHSIVKNSEGQIIYSNNNINGELNNSGIGLGFNYIITHGSKRWIPAISFGAITRYCINGPGSSERPIDFGFQLGFSKRFGSRWHFYGQVGFEQFAQKEFMQGKLIRKFKSNAFSSLASIAWYLYPNFPIYVQYNFHEGVIENFGSFKNPDHQLNIGIKWQMDKDSVLQIGLIENFILVDNSNDFGLLFGYTINLN